MIQGRKVHRLGGFNPLEKMEKIKLRINLYSLPINPLKCYRVEVWE